MSIQSDSPIVLYVPISNRDGELTGVEDGAFIGDDDDIRPSSAMKFWQKKQNQSGNDHMKQYRSELDKCNAKYEQLARNYDKLQSREMELNNFKAQMSKLKMALNAMEPNNTW